MQQPVGVDGMFEENRSRGAQGLIDGSSYADTHVSLVTVEAGKIVERIEPCDPSPLERGTGYSSPRPVG